MIQRLNSGSAPLSVAVATLIFNAIGLVSSLVAKLAAEIDGTGDPDKVASKFVTRGTFLAAPLTTLVVLAVAGWLQTRGNWLGMVGLAALIVRGVLFTISNLGEPPTPEASDPSLAISPLWRAVGIALSLALAGSSAAEFYRRLRSRTVSLPDAKNGN